MGTEIPVSAELMAAYRGTLFRVFHPPEPFVLRIDQYSAGLDALHQQHGVSCSGYITAFNPESVPMSETDNSPAQAALRREIEDMGLPLLEGRGEDPLGKWPGEPSFLILGLPEAACRQLGKRYRQNAVVFAGADAIPRLLLIAAVGEGVSET